MESIFQEVCSTFAFDEIIFPTIEFAGLYERSVGETSDIVQKEMFTLQTTKEALVLRPEGTASVVRSYIQNKLYVSPNENVKVFYKGSMFRKERPQAGRQREFTQLGVEAIGIDNPFVDVEIISLASQYFKQLGLTGIRLEVNSIGCTTCRTDYKEALLMYLRKLDGLCDLCRSRMIGNPLRTLDCKNLSCQTILTDAPVLSDYLCTPCADDYQCVREGLNLLGIPFTENPRLVRGLDYYAKTVFEFVEDSIGAQSTICGGGKYSGLVEELGGPASSGFGFALGVERLLIAMANQGVLPKEAPVLDYYLIWTNEQTRSIQMKIAQNLRVQGYRVEMEFSPKKLKNQLKVALRKGAKYALILGEDELERGIIQVKDLDASTQEEVLIDQFL